MRHFMAQSTHFVRRLEYYGWPLLLLAIRLWIAHIFWRAGMVKLRHCDATVSLFKFEYKTPFIDPELAAYLTTTFELVCPVLLGIGLITRLATIPLLVIIAVIQLTYIGHHDHMYWSLLLGVILLKGPGPLSLDALLHKRS